MDFYYDIKKRISGVSFSHEEIMNYEEDTYDVLGSVFLRELSEKVGQISEHVAFDEEYRFDAISYNHLKTSDFWWVIMEYNNYIDFDIKLNEKYKIPNLKDINRLKHSLIIRKNLNNLD